MSGGKVGLTLDPNRGVWQRITRKGLFDISYILFVILIFIFLSGTPPSARCGAVLTMYKNKES